MTLQQSPRILKFVFLASIYLSMQSTAQDVCSIPNKAFNGGEEMVFKAYYNWGFIWIPAGEAVFSVSEDDRYYEILVVGSSYRAYDGFFKLRDRFYTKIDKSSMLPVAFERTVNEGDYKKYERIEFDQESRIATTLTGKTKSTAVQEEIAFSQCMHDLLSLLYFMRNINVEDYKQGDYLPTKIFFDKVEYNVKVRYEGKEEDKAIKDLGNFNTILVVPDLISGTVFNEGDKMKVWVSDDKNKLPLLVESPLKVGSLKAVLKSYKGLRNATDAKL